MQTGTEKQNNETENRTARAEAIADVIVAYSKKYGQPVEEILAGDYHDWHCFLQTSYALLPIKGKKLAQPSEETKQLVRTFVKRDTRVEEPSKKNIHTQDSDCTLDPETNCCRVCGVDHGATCIKCSGRGFRLPTCPEMVAEEGGSHS